MKRFLALIVTVVFSLTLSSCNIDSSYDLSESLDNSNLGFGTDDTSFDLPLLNINIAASKLTTKTSTDEASISRSDDSSSESNILNIIANISSLLPSDPEEGSIDLEMLGEEEYVDTLVDTLFEELSTDAEKREAFIESAIDKKESEDSDYTALIAQLEVVLGSPLESYESVSSCADAFKEALDNDSNALVMTAVENLKSAVTQTIISKSDEIQTTFDIYETINDTVELGEDIIDMLDKNLDGDKNTLSLLFQVSSNLPFDITLTPAIELSSGEVVAISEFKEDLSDSEINRTNITKEQFRSLLSGMTFTAIVSIENYDPTVGDLDLDGKTIVVKLIARKTGSITL